MQGVGSLKIRAALRSIELAGYDIDTLSKIINHPKTRDEFLIAEISRDDDFWLAIDAKFCGGDLTKLRLDLPTDKWRSYVEGYARRITYIYPFKMAWAVGYVIAFHGEMSIGVRDITYSSFVTELNQTEPRHADLAIAYSAAEVNGIPVMPGCLGFMLDIESCIGPPNQSLHRMHRTVTFGKEQISENYATVMELAAIEVLRSSRKYFNWTINNDRTGLPVGIYDIKQHILRMFAEVDEREPGIVSIFSDNDRMETRQRSVIINGISKGEDVTLTIYVSISQLKF